MEQRLRKAKVIASGQIVQVYKLIKGGWCNYADCSTEYQNNELEFLD